MARTAAARHLDHAGQHARHLSPLRYPGAKSRMVKDLASVISRARELRAIPRIELFVEPFAGGASTSLRLVSMGLVERVMRMSRAFSGGVPSERGLAAVRDRLELLESALRELDGVEVHRPYADPPPIRHQTDRRVS